MKSKGFLTIVAEFAIASCVIFGVLALQLPSYIIGLTVALYFGYAWISR